MSSTDSNSSILVTDDAKTIKRKIDRYAFSGGGATVEEHRQNGANLEVDVPYQYLTFFLEDDDKLAEIGRKYGSGEMLTSEIKAELAKVIQEFVRDFQERRAKITDDDVRKFLEVRKMDKMPSKWAGTGAGGEMTLMTDKPANPLAAAV